MQGQLVQPGGLIHYWSPPLKESTGSHKEVGGGTGARGSVPVANMGSLAWEGSGHFRSKGDRSLSLPSAVSGTSTNKARVFISLNIELWGTNFKWKKSVPTADNTSKKKKKKTWPGGNSMCFHEKLAVWNKVTGCSLENSSRSDLRPLRDVWTQAPS